MDTSPKSIRLVDDRSLSLAEDYRVGGEPLTRTVQRIMERYDTIMHLRKGEVAEQQAEHPSPAHS